MKRCFIFAALPVDKLDVMPTNGDLIIACDKGYLTTEKFSLTPDVIIGDFDSLGYVPNSENVIKLPVNKDDTDTGYAIKYAISESYDQIIVYGAVDGLLDHSIANLQLGFYAAKQNINIVFVGNEYDLTAVTNGSIKIKSGNKRFSVFAACECTGVSIKGAVFPLDDAPLSPFYPLGVSNCQNGCETVVSVKDGTLAVIYYKQ